MSSFYISLPIDSEDQSFQALILHVIENLEKEVVNRPFNLVHFYLLQPYTIDDNQSFFVEYDFSTEEELKLRAERQAYNKKYKVAPITDPVILESYDNESWTLHFLTLSMAQGENQDNCLLLLRVLNDYLTTVGDIKVIDCIYHQRCDDDGLDHPYLHLYYKKSKNGKASV